MFASLGKYVPRHGSAVKGHPIPAIRRMYTGLVARQRVKVYKTWEYCTSANASCCRERGDDNKRTGIMTCTACSKYSYVDTDGRSEKRLIRFYSPQTKGMTETSTPPTTCCSSVRQRFLGTNALPISVLNRSLKIKKIKKITQGVPSFGAALFYKNATAAGILKKISSRRT